MALAAILVAIRPSLSVEISAVIEVPRSPMVAARPSTVTFVSWLTVYVFALPSDVETVMDVTPDEMILFAATLPVLCGVGVAFAVAFELPAKLENGSTVNIPRTVITIVIFFIGGV